MTHPPEQDALQPMLRDAEADLAQRLEEACAMHDVHDESTGELMRLEETLLDAARAAKQAVSVRRRLRSLGGRGRATRDGGATDAGGGPQGAADREVEPSSVRDFVDEDRVEWRVWEVIPGQTRAGVRGEQHHQLQLGDYQAGWLAFEAVAEGVRRRLRDYPRDWNTLSNDDLERLLQRAEVVRNARRAPGPRAPRPDAPPS